jgi:DNA (cytosine-5)-methyltransferase 1
VMRCPRPRPLVFVDAFAGCGGLSLGLLQAGLKGLFAIEHDKFAFDTLRANLIDGFFANGFEWPTWLPKEPIGIDELLDTYAAELRSLDGLVDILVGGPPCQGFSSAGRRRHDDPRNRLVKSYLRVVDMIKPQAVIIENVRGFTVNFKNDDAIDNYADLVRNQLAKHYIVHEELLDLSMFGVPQARTRYFLVAIRPGTFTGNPLAVLKARIPAYLRSLGLRAPTSAYAAISDLEISRGGVQDCPDMRGFSEIKYTRPRSRYQKLMNSGAAPTDLRLARHAPTIKRRFQRIIELSHSEGRLNTSISAKMRARFHLLKRALRVLDPDRPAPTITSMPDDLLHYSEPRTLTVRENARLQSFPDWFAFHGKYTSGGHRRRHEVPRFTQVANAVPPLVARALGLLMLEILSSPAITSGAKRRHAERQPDLGSRYAAQAADTGASWFRPE